MALWAARLRQMRPYDLRHSYVTEILETSQDLYATQLLSGHADLRTTLGYARRAVHPTLVHALGKVEAAGGFGGAPAAPFAAAPDRDTDPK